MILDNLYKQNRIHPPKWLLANTCYLAKVGSESYGAKVGDSDTDIQGICIPPKADIFPHLRGEIVGFGRQIQRFEVWQEHHVFDEQKNLEFDFSVYSIVKFFHLAMENNPNILDVISVPTKCVVHATAIGQMIRDNRKLFYHAGCFHKFRGYAFAQFSKLEKGANKRNPRRAENIEKFGYDTKFLMHVVRLALECEQLLLTGELILDKDSQTLLSIRRGEWDLDDAKKWWVSKERDLETAYTNCKVLPHVPNQDAIKKLLLNCIEQHYGSLDAVIKTPIKSEQLISDLKDLIEKYSL